MTIQRCPHDGGACHHGCDIECFRFPNMCLSQPWPGFPVPGSAPVVPDDIRLVDLSPDAARSSLDRPALHLDYNTGPSSWLHAAVAFVPNRARDFSAAELRAFASPGPLVFVDAPATVRDMDNLRLADIVRALTPQSAPSYFEHNEAAENRRQFLEATQPVRCPKWAGEVGVFTKQRYRKD